MFTQLSLENFKGINDEVTIELRPLTLLFGSNSSGKSTIIHAFHYLKEIFDNGNFNPDKTQLGGDLVDLGGFQNLVYKHKLENNVKLRLNLDVSEIELPENLNWDPDFKKDVRDIAIDNVIKEIEKSTLTEIEKGERFYAILTSSITNVSVELEINWINELNNAEGIVYRLYIANDLLVVIKLYALSFYNGAYFPQYGLTYINFNHPILEDIIKEFTLETISVKNMDENNILIKLPKLINILPNFKSIEYNKINEITGLALDGDDNLFINIITNLIKNIHQQFCFELRYFRYIGPLREIPPRNILPKNLVDEKNWFNGLAAWDAIYAGYPSIELINEWLNKLKTGYQLKEFYYYELPVEILDILQKVDKSKIDNTFIHSIEEGLDDFEMEMYKVLIGNNEKEYEELKQYLQTTIKDILDEYKLRLEENNNPYQEHNRIAEYYLKKKRIYLVDTETGTELLPYDIGVGISQVIPVIVAALTQNSSILTIEQPEIHSHPEIEVELADLFVSEIKKRDNVIYLLETHGEHFLLLLLKNIRKTSSNSYSEKDPQLTPDQLSIYFFNKTNIGLDFKKIEINNKGQFSNRWPKGFFPERKNELFDGV